MSNSLYKVKPRSLPNSSQGKDVAVLLEGRARFDELQNLYWYVDSSSVMLSLYYLLVGFVGKILRIRVTFRACRRLQFESSGVRILPLVPNYKVHAKILYVRHAGKVPIFSFRHQ
jgi:polyphosphate kinase